MDLERRTTGITEHEELTQRKSEPDDRVLRVHAIVTRFVDLTPELCSVPFDVFGQFAHR
jgi:hypothetical protein